MTLEVIILPSRVIAYLTKTLVPGVGNFPLHSWSEEHKIPLKQYMLLILLLVDSQNMEFRPFC